MHIIIDHTPIPIAKKQQYYSTIQHFHNSVLLILIPLILAIFSLFLASYPSRHAQFARDVVVVHKVINKVPKSPGGKYFDRQLGIKNARRTLLASTHFVWKTFGQTTPDSRKHVTSVTLFVKSMPDIAFTIGNQIHLSAEFVEKVSAGGGNTRFTVTGLLYHEMAHVWQWDGKGKAPAGLIEGIADYVALKAGYINNGAGRRRGQWGKAAGQGERWDQGYDVTARFLYYCDTLRPGFVAELNSKMRSGWSVEFFDELLGKSVDNLWWDYKARS